MVMELERSWESATQARAPWPLVGRGEVLDQLREVLRSGNGAAVLVGRPGLGRTRLAEETIRSFATTHVVLRAAGTASAASIPFGALSRVLAAARPGADFASLEASLVGAGPDPVLVVVDDAHLLDDASAAFVHHLVLGGSASVLVTIADGRPVPDAITALWKDGLAERIDLDPLDRPTVGALLDAAIGGPFDPLTERDLWDLSGGAPLVLRELVLGAVNAGAIVREEALWRLAGPVPLSRRLIEIVEAQTIGLDERALRCMHLLALTDELGLAMLVDLVGDRAVADLEARDLLAVGSEGRRRPCRLSSSLLAKVVRLRLPVSTADGLRVTLIGALEAPGRRDDDRLRAAELRLDAGLEPDLDLIFAAARGAYFANDFVRAIHLARAVIERTPSLDALMLLGETLYSAGHAEEAEDVLAAVDLCAATPRQRGLVWMIRTHNMFGNLHRPDDALDLIRVALDHFQEGEWHDEFIAVRANFLLLQGRPKSALEVVEPLLSCNEGRALFQVATVASPSLALLGRTEEAIAVAERALELRVALGDELHLPDVHTHLVALVLAYSEAGRLVDAEALARRGHDDAVEARSADGRAFSALVVGRVALAQGRPETATRFFSEAVLVYRDAQARGCLRWGYAGLAFSRAMAGDVAGAVAAVNLLDRAPPTAYRMLETDVLRARAWTADLERRPGRARRLLVEAATEARDTGQRSLESAALHDMVRLGMSGHATARLVELVDHVDGAISPVRAAHALALANANAAELDVVADRFEQLGAMLAAAEAASEAARLHQEAGNRRAATRSAVRARQIHARCEGARLGSLPWAPTVEPLTRREREIALLAAEGLTSPSIGNRLSVSVRTVDNHLRRAYEKLGIKGRHELGPAMAHW